MGTLIQDLRYGARMLWRSPAFTVVAVLALALGIGATTAIYTVVDAVMLRPLPFPGPQQLVVVETYLRHHKGATSFPDFVDYRDRNQSFTSVAAWEGAPVTLTGVQDPQDVDGIKATPELFGVLGAPMTLGRGFTADEARPGSRVVVLSHQLWRTRFHGDRDIIGKPVSIDSQQHIVVGVLPEHYPWPMERGDGPAVLILPYPRDDNDVEQSKNRGSHSLRALARLKPGVSPAQAQLDMDAVVAQMKKDHPGEDEAHLSVGVQSLREAVTARSRPAIIMWLAAVLCVLAIACANVAGLLLARATVRQREIAIRVALGAKRGRIVRQMLTESVMLGVLGGGVGVLLALWLVDLLVALVTPSLPRIHDIGVDGRALGVTFAMAVLTGVIFGLLPALQASRPDLNDALKETARSTAHGRNRRARNALVVGEIALALLLLVGAGLTLRSFARLAKTDPGFRAEGLTVAHLALPSNRYAEDKDNIAYRLKVAQAVAALPGVEGVTLGAPLPFSNADMTVSVNPPGQKPTTALPNARYVSVAPNWFSVLGIPMERGRTFNAVEDRLDGPGALVISHSFAARMWPGEDAVGKKVAIGICAIHCEGEHLYEVIGIVGDIHHDSLDSAEPPTMYTALGHIPLGFIGVAARSQNPKALTPLLRQALLSVDADLPPTLLQEMRDGISESLASQRVLMILLGLFAAVALILATIGVYGVISYTVTQRTRELGIRVALGAGTGEILGLVLGESLRLSLLASLLGVGGALVGGRALESQLYGVAATDPATLIAVTLLILVVCLVAAFLPARRAAKVDPMVALRYE
jgi:putative ABC transport system permease protein